jgi:hypothetical protein
MHTNVLRAYLRWIVSLALGASLMTSAPVWAADVPITETARKHFNAGVALLKDPDGARYEEAYREFKVAYASSPSWKILGNLGLTAMKLERDSEAIAAFERYLAEGDSDLDASERADVGRDLDTLRAASVEVTITTSPESAVITDERIPVQGSTIRNRYQVEGGRVTLRIRGGHHRVTAAAEDGQQLIWEFDADPGSTYARHFDLRAVTGSSQTAASRADAAPGGTRPIPATVIVGLVATGAFAAGTGIAGAMALGRNSDYEAANGQDADRARSLRDETQTLNLVTDVLLACTLASAGVTTYLYLKRPSLEPSSSAALRIAPNVAGGGANLLLTGKF